MLKNKCIILGISGGIAAYKMANLASLLVKKGAKVHVIMTENATKFISPITFETLTKNKCMINTFDRNFEYKVEHIEVAKEADIFVVAPATANIISKLANGLADDMLSTVVLACTCKKLVCPAMNTRMYENPIVKDNIDKLKKYDFDIMEADKGYLACGDTGVGKLPDIEDIYDRICYHIEYEKDLLGKNILVSAGATREDIDPVRFISNHSTGKMGIELAKAAYYRGANVKLVLGVSNEKPVKTMDIQRIISAKDMYKAIIPIAKDMDIIIKAAAVADYRPRNIANEKIKKNSGDTSIELERTDDILAKLGEEKREGQFLCGFSMETSNLIENSKKKLLKKNLDMIVANNLKVPGAGFGVDTNVVTVISKNNQVDFTLQTKEELAHKILDEIKKEIN